MKSPTNWATDGYFFLFDLVFVPPDNGTQSHDPSHGLLHAHAPLHVAGHANGSSAAPGWFVKVINGFIKDLATVAAYLDDVIVSIWIPPLTSSPLWDCSSSCGNGASSSRRRKRRLVPPTWIFSVTPSPPRVFDPTLEKSLPSRECRCLLTSSNYGPSLVVYPTTGNLWQTWPKGFNSLPGS